MESNDIGTNVPTASELSQMENDLATEGAAIPGLFQYFETLGFTDTQIRTMGQQALANPPTLPTESVVQAMQDLSNLLTSVSVPVASIIAEPPTAVGHNYSLSENSSIIVPAAQGLLANAADPNNLQLIATDFSEPAHGVLQANSDGSFTYTADSGYSGLDSFTYEAGDGVFLSQPSTVSLTITPLESLVFTQEPSRTTAGKAIAPAVTVTIESLQGQVITTDNSDVTLSVYSGPGILSGTTSVQAKNGVATLKNLTLDIAGTYTLIASDASDSLSVNSTSFNITPAAAARLAFIQQPTNTTAGKIISPAVTVAVEDRFGNIVTSNNSYVTLALASDPACNPRLNKTLTAQVKNGIATFNNLSLTAAGTYTLKATDGRFASATSSSFQIAPADAVRMVFIKSPLLSKPGKKFNVEVELLDKYGNVATNNTSEMTLSLGLHRKGAALSGMPMASVVNGIATFKNLSINEIGLYTLLASDSNTSLPAAVIPLLMI